MAFHQNSRFQNDHDENEEHCFWFANEIHTLSNNLDELNTKCLKCVVSNKQIQSLLPLLSKLITETALVISTATDKDYPKIVVWHSSTHLKTLIGYNLCFEDCICLKFSNEDSNITFHFAQHVERQKKRCLLKQSRKKSSSCTNSTDIKNREKKQQTHTEINSQNKTKRRKKLEKVSASG